MIEIIDTTLEEEVRLFVNYISDEQKKADEVIMRYGWLAEYTALKFSRMGVDVDELYDACCDALLVAASEYHMGCGMRFAMFALEYVRNAAYDLIQEENAIKRIDSLSDPMLRFRSALGNIRNNIRNDSTDWHVANALGIDETELMDIIYGAPIMTKDNINNASRQAADSIKNASETASVSFFKKALNRIDEIIEQVEKDEQ